MGASPPVYSSVSGPAKWAAVVALSFACGGGLVYSFTRSARRSEAAGPLVKEMPAREVARAAPVVRPEPSREAGTKEDARAVRPEEEPEGAPKVEEAVAPIDVAPAVVTPAPEPEPEPPPAAPVAVGQRINLNTATQAELELLPRVGPATAKAIISYRSLHGPFRTVQDLDKVKGIGPKTLEKLAPLVTVE